MALHDGREFVEKAADRDAFDGVERTGERADVGRQGPDVAQDFSARVRRDLDLEPAPVGQMGLARKVAALGQPVDQCRDGARRDVEAASSVGPSPPAALTCVIAASSGWLMPSRRARAT
jgi:hypothetical protein